jgi:4-hydroxymandelate synthase
MTAFEDLHVDHVSLAVGDLTSARAWWTDHYGMRPYAGTASGGEPVGARMICLGRAGIRLLLTEARSDDHPAAVYTRRHGDGVCDIALGTSNAAAAYREALRRGAAAVSPPRLKDGVVTASIVGFGDVTHTFVQRLPSTDAHALPGLVPFTGSPVGTEEPAGLRTIDHFAVCLEAGQLLPTVAYYEQVLGFRTVFTERIIVGRQVMDSIAVQSLSGTCTLTLLEPDLSQDPGQIDQFLKDHGGPGIQHIAFAADDIVREVSGLGATGVEFLRTPGAYYDQMPQRLVPVRHSVERLRELSVLVDQDQDGQLFQIFTRSVHPRGTLFFEIIERFGARTFGSGNIKALYSAVEAERALAAHRLDEALGPHIRPVLFDVGQASVTGVLAVNHVPTVGHLTERGPERVLPLVVNEYEKFAIRVVKGVHAGLLLPTDRLGVATGAAWPDISAMNLARRSRPVSMSRGVRELQESRSSRRSLGDAA